MPNSNHMPIRRQVFDRLHNVRDLGGYATPNGMTAWGRVYRSGRLFDPTPEDIKRLDALDIHTVIDLRTDNEITKYPDAILNGVRHEHTDFLDFIQDMNDPEESQKINQPAGLARMYEAILDKSSGAVRRALELVAQGLEGGQAVLFHCSIGKDRTGVLAALLLLLCGVDRTDIIADYQTSRTYLEGFLQKNFPGGAELQSPAYDSLPGTITILLDAIDQRGGVRSYLSSIGLEASVMDTLIKQLTVTLPNDMR